MKVIQAPKDFEKEASLAKTVVFLAGSIEMGKAEHWQERFLSHFTEEDILFLNPRRDDWKPLPNRSAEDPDFRAQVEWEQKGLARADIIALYFDPETESPISLLELGEYAKSGKITVCCPPGFWKKGNIDLLCQENQIPESETLEALVAEVKGRLG